MSKTGTRHAFPQASLLDEIFLKAAQLLVDEVVGLVDEADGI